MTSPDANAPAGRDEAFTAAATGDEAAIEASLRPQRLDEFVGQRALKEQMTVILEASVARGEPPDHMLFAGPPGLGKTSLAGIVANELGANVFVTSGPAIERSGDLAAILTNLSAGAVLFIDELHRLPKVVEEVLYPAMEDFQLDIVLGKGPAARSIRLDVPKFTLVAATTRTALVAAPLRDRFGLVERLDYYDADELTQIVERTAAILGVDIERAGATQIAKRSRGTPRIANRLLRRVRDFAQVRSKGHIDAAAANEGLTMFGVDELGLDKLDRSILGVLTVGHEGKPVGLTTLAIAVSEEPDTVENVYEPFLIQQGLLKRTPSGRVATSAAFAHLGVAVPTDDGQTNRLDLAD